MIVERLLNSLKISLVIIVADRTCSKAYGADTEEDENGAESKAIRHRRKWDVK